VFDRQIHADRRNSSKDNLTGLVSVHFEPFVSVQTSTNERRLWHAPLAIRPIALSGDAL
jgi:hypothetical protein